MLVPAAEVRYLRILQITQHRCRSHGDSVLPIKADPAMLRLHAILQGGGMRF